MEPTSQMSFEDSGTSEYFTRIRITLRFRYLINSVWIKYEVSLLLSWRFALCLPLFYSLHSLQDFS